MFKSSPSFFCFLSSTRPKLRVQCDFASKDKDNYKCVATAAGPVMSQVSDVPHVEGSLEPVAESYSCLCKVDAKSIIGAGEEGGGRFETTLVVSPYVDLSQPHCQAALTPTHIALVIS